MRVGTLLAAIVLILSAASVSADDSPPNPLANPPEPENPLAKPPVTEDPPAENPLARPPEVAAATDLMTAAKAAYTAPAALVAQATTYSTHALDAALLASRMTGGTRLVTTGTLTQTAAGTYDFRYSAGPDDRLHVALADGTTMDFFILSMRGPLGDGSSDFLTSAHDLSVRVVVPEKLDLTLTSKRKRRSNVSYDGTHTASIKGTFLLDEKPAKVNLTAEGTFYFESSFGGMEHRSKMAYTGALSVSGVEYRLAESWDHNIVSLSGTIGNRAAQKTSSSIVRTVGTSWVQGGTTRAFRDLTVLTAFTNGIPSFADARYWNASGVLMVNDTPVARATITADDFHLRLVFTDKDLSTEFERWPVRRPR